MTTKNHSENDPFSSSQSTSNQKRSILWIILFLFVSGGTFFLGVIVGRGSAPALFDYQKIETEIAMLSRTFAESQKIQSNIESDTLAIQAELDYPELLKKKTEDTARMPTPTPEKPAKPAETPKTVPSHEPAPATTSPSTKPDLQAAVKPETMEPAPDAIKTTPETKIKSMYDIKASQARETVSERAVSTVPERAPAATPKPSQAPAAENKSASAQPVAIQLTTLVDRRSADALIESLRSKGISASKTPKMVQGKGVWYQVVIGKFTSPAEADAVLNKLRQENMDASLVKP